LSSGGTRNCGRADYRRDIPDAEVRFLDTGHFALETHATEIGAAMRTSSAGSSRANGRRISALRGAGPERAADIGMPAAVDVTDVRTFVQQLLDSASSAPVGTTLGYPVIRRCSFSLADSP
jgi:hypothetical protein